MFSLDHHDINEAPIPISLVGEAAFLEISLLCSPSDIRADLEILWEKCQSKLHSSFEKKHASHAKSCQFKRCKLNKSSETQLLLVVLLAEALVASSWFASPSLVFESLEPVFELYSKRIGTINYLLKRGKKWWRLVASEIEVIYWLSLIHIWRCRRAI